MNDKDMNDSWNNLPKVDSTESDAAQEEYGKAWQLLDHDEQMFCEAASCEVEIRPEWAGVGVVSGRWLCGPCCATERATMRKAR